MVNKLKYDIVIVTRNRTDALMMSIPLMLSQSRSAEKLIVIDSSDSHEPVRDLVIDLTKNWTGNVLIFKQSPPGITRQRNKGLQYVDADIVFFPDDDSMWHDGFAEEIMKVYENDLDQLIGGVCGKPVAISPKMDSSMSYKRSPKSVIKTIIQPLRNRIENRFFPKPFNLYAYDAWNSMSIPNWLESRDAVIVENMSGFRMTFRTPLIKSLGFEELLAYKVGYSTHEDMEASISVLSHGKLLVGALNAHVFHHVHPSKRAGGFAYGFCWITNYLLISKKYFDPDSRPWKAINNYLFYKLVGYFFGALFDSYRRDIFLGALRAFKQRNEILECNPNEIGKVFMSFCDINLAKS